MLVLSSPAIFALEITAVCSSHCSGCSNVYASREVSPLSASRWERLLRGFAPSAAQLRLTGGEPTLHPEFFAILAATARYEAEVVILTNARWEDPGRLLGRLKRHPRFSNLLVSLHGARAKSHDMFTGIAGSFEETISNISRSVEAGIEVTLSTVVTRHNCDEVEKIVDLAHTLGVTGVTITRYLGSSRLGIEATDEQLRVVFEAVDKSDPESFVQHGTCVPQCFTRNSSRGCRAGVAYVAIDPWGNVRPCTLSPTVAGSLLQNSIEEIWSGSTMNSWRARIPIDCLDCPAYSVCHGGCRALQELREDGVDPLRRKPLLEYELKKSLPADLRPKARLRFRTEPFGYAAMGNGEVLPVSRTALDVIEACNGQQTFRHLVDRFGEESLSLLGELWTRGMLEAV